MGFHLSPCRSGVICGLVFLCPESFAKNSSRSARYITHQNTQPLKGFEMDYLLKTEASAYSFADLLRDKTTIWDGVTNPVALKNLRAMKPGDRLVIYHTGDEKRAVGTASVVSVDVSDAKNPSVQIKVGKAIPQPLSLADIKQSKAFADSPLVRQGRLSVVPLNEQQYKILTTSA